MIFCLSFKGLKIMIILAFLLFLFCVIMLLISIIKPKWGTLEKRPELKRKQICLFYLAMCFVSLFLMVKATPDDAMLSQQSGISEMSRADKEYASKNVFCKKFGISVDDAKILKQHNSIGVESVTDATKDEKGMYSLNVTAKVVIHIYF